MTIRWSSRALSDLAAIYAYVATFSESAAGHTVDRLSSAAETLARLPQLGRPGRIAGRRELVVERYVLVYRVRREEIYILTVEYGAQRR
jgi:toxin ParE1/3/4